MGECGAAAVLQDVGVLGLDLQNIPVHNCNNYEAQAVKNVEQLETDRFLYFRMTSAFEDNLDIYSRCYQEKRNYNLSNDGKLGQSLLPVIHRCVC